VRPWLAWWLALAGLYLLLADTVDLAELAAGAVAAALGATAATLVRRGRPTARPRARWLAAAVRPLIGVVTDLAPLARVLLVRGILRRPGEGTLVEVAFRATSDEPDDVAHRALTQALGSLAPNTVVVDVDETRGVLVAHQLSPTPDAAARAAPLP
jgi:multisubunit Na+/H+ antiporter MnhE subunit